MYPTQLLVLMLLVTAGALAAQARARVRRAARLRALASREKAHYSPVDRFGLGPRVAKHFPVPGVADVRVSDLLYRSDERGHRYVFTVDYTRGVLGVKRRVRGVALMAESRSVAGREVPPEIKVADAVVGGSMFTQYEALLRA
jgi:hypothetical protein